MTFFEAAKFLVSSSPTYLIFWVAQNCNARCAFCFNWEDNLKKNRDLTIDEIDNIARQWGHLKYLTIAGGEPTLRSDLPDIVSAFVDHAGLQIASVVTNGIKFESMLKQAEEMCQRHPHVAINIGVSIDFIGKKHDEHRKAKGCYAGAIKIIDGIKELRSKYPNLMVNAVGTYTKDSSQSILETATHIMTTYEIPYVMNLIRGQVEDMTLSDINIEHYHETATKLLNLERHYIPQTTRQSAFRFALEDLGVNNIYQSLKTGKIQSTCQAGRQAVVLEANGLLRLCEILPDNFGNVRDNHYNVPSMLASPQANEIIKNILHTNCHCTWECINRANIAFDVSKWPKLFKLAFEKGLV